MRKKGIKEILVEIYRDFIYKFQIENKVEKGEGVLLISTDGIGDLIARDRLMKEMILEYGKENIHILVKDRVSFLVEKYGISKENILVFTREERKKISGSKKFLNKIAHLKLKKIYAFEPDPHEFWFLKYFNGIEKIANKGKTDIYKYLTKVLTLNDCEFSYVGEYVKRYIQESLNKNLTLEEIKPDMSTFYNKEEKYREDIAFGVGSAERLRIMSAQKQEEILLAISEKYPNKKIYLLGKGAFEEKLMKEMKLIESKSNIVNLVGKITLEESNTIINSCKIYIGMESGLYNMAFAMGKNTIGFFADKINFYNHDRYKNVKVIVGKDGENGYFGNPNLNGIKVSDVLDTMEEFFV